MSAPADRRASDVLVASDRRIVTRRAVRNDALVAAALAITAAATMWLYGLAGLQVTDPPPVAVSIAWLLLLFGPLAVRRRFPASVAAVASGVFIAGGLLGVHEYFVSNIALFLAIYTLGAWGANRLVANLVRALIVAAMLLWLVLAIIWQSAATAAGEVTATTAVNAINLVINLLFFAAAWWFGDSAWQSAGERALLEARTAELELERQRTAEQAVALERVRIARELHDAVAHHVSVMGLQAAAARRVLRTDPAVAAHSLEAVELSARQAIEELRSLVYTLREPDAPDDPGAATSTMTLERVRALVEDARSAGGTVRFESVGQAAPLPPTTGLAVYRLVQESLTNVRKHARGQAADVRLRWSAARLEIDVSNDGLPARPRSGGFGLIGMRERITAVGGRVEAGPKPRGGWRVRAEIPLSQAGTR